MSNSETESTTGPEETVSTDNTETPEISSAEADNGEVELSEEEQQLKAVLDELESLREENSKLKESNGKLETKTRSQFDRMKDILLGKIDVSQEEVKAVERSYNSPIVDKDYYTRELDLS